MSYLVILIVVALFGIISVSALSSSTKSRERSFRFWKKIASKARERMEHHSGGGERCPNCRRWSWEMDEEPRWRHTPVASTMRCGTCAHTSRWATGPGIMIPLKPLMAPIILDTDD